jgi:hypothetical protein
MVKIDVREVAAAKIGLLARAWGITRAEAVDRLLEEFEAGTGLPDSADVGTADQRLGRVSKLVTAAIR